MWRPTHRAPCSVPLSPLPLPICTQVFRVPGGQQYVSPGNAFIEGDASR